LKLSTESATLFGILPSPFKTNLPSGSKLGKLALKFLVNCGTFVNLAVHAVVAMIATLSFKNKTQESFTKDKN